MATLFDYLQWRGDLSFRQSGFNIIDSLILSRFSYLPFDGILHKKPLSISELGTLFFTKNGKKHPDIVLPQDITLLEALMTSKRFKNLRVQHYQNRIDVKLEQQFSAITIQLDAHTTYVAFRGTDKTLVGWKEDFNMAFEKRIPSQRCAINYLKLISSDCRARIIIGGHSKGGNLALYSGLFAPQNIKEKIIAIHNFDGPGFHNDLLTTPRYQQRRHLMQTFLPETAIVGTIFHHDHSITVVKSNATGLLQHDTFTWQVTHNNFVSVEKTDHNSEKVQNSLNALLKHLKAAERQKVVNTIYNIFVDTGISSLTDFQKLDFSTIKHIIHSMQTLSKEDKILLQQTARIFIKHFKETTKNKV